MFEKNKTKKKHVTKFAFWWEDIGGPVKKKALCKVLLLLCFVLYEAKNTFESR